MGSKQHRNLLPTADHLGNLRSWRCDISAMASSHLWDKTQCRNAVGTQNIQQSGQFCTVTKHMLEKLHLTDLSNGVSLGKCP